MLSAYSFYLFSFDGQEINSHVVRGESILVQVVSAYLTSTCPACELSGCNDLALGTDIYSILTSSWLCDK
jgi:hypothetical protein